MNKNIEVEGGEIAIRNSHGDLAIIPKDKRDWVKQKLAEGCHSCIDSLVETLPIASQYAQDGSVYPPNTKVKVNHNNQIKEYDINSSEYRDLYNSGKLMNYDKNTDTYIATPIKEVTVTAEAPQWLKYKREYEKNNPKSDYINSYLTPFAKLLGNTKTNYPKRLDDEYEQKSLDYVSEQLVKNKPQGKLSRAEWLNQMSDKEEELIKRNPKYQSSLWADTKRGLTSLVEQNPLQAFQDILDSSDYTNREKQEMLKDYTDHPVMSKLGDATKILNPLTVPSKMIQSTYKDDYSFSDALEGKKNNAGIVEDIVTDPLNLVGVGLAGKLSKADKVIDATKAGSKVLNKLDDAVNNTNRIKFDDLKNDNEFFRVIVGDEAFDDIVQTQKIRTKRPSSVGKTGSSSINLDRRGATAFPSFSKGSPSLSYANDNPNHYIIRTADESIKPSTSGRHGKGTTMFPTDKSGKHLTELDASKVQVYKHVGNGEYELVNTAKPIVSSVDNVSKQVTKSAWKMEELPGLHIKSTMSNGPISKIVEPKTGLINVEQALGIIGKESGGAEKLAIVKQGLGENIPKKMDYNEFRKVVQDQLIPLERQFATHSSNYGIERLGFVPKVQGNAFERFRTVMNTGVSDFNKPRLLENQTLILGNKNKFGRGSNAHGNPDETLGHIHFLRDAESPDVLTVTQIQSDAFQGTHRIMPKTQQEALEKVSKLKEEGIEIKSMFGDGKESSNSVLANYEKHLQLDDASAKNFTQKQLLDKNHQERYLQELVDYAGKRGDVNKVRVPTSETAAKVQGYKQRDYDIVFRELEDLRKGNISDVTKLSSETKNVITSQGNTSLVDISETTFTPRNYKDVLSDLDKNKDFARFLENKKGIKGYEPEHQTILKKYSEQPKLIKKLFGVEPKTVTDSKGNTWYEFDIPKKFKEGKGEIKAFGLIPPAIGIGAAIQSQNQNKSEQ